MSDKYIVKNCPCYNNERFIGGFLDDKATFCTYYGKKCQDCTNCVMKQIYKLCKDDYTQFGDKELRYDTLEEIIKLLNVQEIE